MSGYRQQVPDKRGGNPDLSSAPQKRTTVIASFITEIRTLSHLQGELLSLKSFHNKKRGCAAPVAGSCPHYGLWPFQAAR